MDGDIHELFIIYLLLFIYHLNQSLVGSYILDTVNKFLF